MNLQLVDEICKIHNQTAYLGCFLNRVEQCLGLATR